MFDNHVFRILIVFVVLIYCFSWVSGSSAAESTSDARNKTIQFIWGVSTAIGDSTQRPTSSETLTMRGDSTPFLHREINGRTLSKSYYSEMVFTYNNMGEDETRLPNTTILSDPNTGQVIKIVTELGHLSVNEIGEMSVDEAEKQLRASREVFVSLLPGPPNISYQQALSACPIHPSAAKRIESIPLRVTFAKDTLSVWMISLTGILPMSPGKGGPLPLNQRNHIRYAVSAESGKLLYFTNTPQYPLKGEEQLWQPYIDSMRADRSREQSEF